MTIAKATSIKTILFVDDSASMREWYRHLLAELLPSDRYAFLIAEDGQEALASLQANKVDLIVTDYHMPLMTGVDLIREVRFRKLFMPTVLVTQDIGSGVKMDARSVGITTTLSKPLEAKKFVEIVRKLIERH